MCGFAHAQSTPKKADLPAEDRIRFYSDEREESRGALRYLRRNAKVQTSEFIISADTIDFNSDTNWAYARGHVHFDHYLTGEKLNAESAEYNVKTQNGKFYGVNGTAPAKIVASPAVLTTTNPFYFEALWAERIKARYILHHGFLTDCKIDEAWWRFRSPKFDIIPGQRAFAKNTVFLLRGVPVFYLPYFYRPLGKKDRQSGFLTPNFGHSSLYGYIYGAGYYWAINRSYDMTAVGLYYTLRGPALRYDFRGKPNDVTDFDFNYYGVKDGGYKSGNTVQKQGGLEFELNAKTQIMGFTGRLDYVYLSSFIFRQVFSYSIVSAVPNEVFSIGFLQRHFHNDDYSLNFVFQRQQLFNAATPADQPPNQNILQKFPAAEFYTRDQDLTKKKVPLWWSLDALAGAYSRSEPTGQETISPVPESQVLNTGAYFRSEIAPRVATNFQWKSFALSPSVSLDGVGYSNSFSQNTTTYIPVGNFACGYPLCPPVPVNTVALSHAATFRKDANFAVDFRLPTMERVYRPAKWMHLGEKVKHVAEIDAKYEYVTGIENFNRIIRFDSRDVLSDTNQATVSFTNHFYKKDKTGKVNDVIKWKVSQARFFDPTFGGAAVAGQRTVVLATEEFSPYAFLDGPRNYSPVSSVLTVSPYNFFSLEWRTEYDPVRRQFIDRSVTGNVRYSKFNFSLSDTSVTTDPLLVPQAHQIAFGGGYGNYYRRGWNASALYYYDVLLSRRVFNFIQGSYNTDCCGFSVQLRQINLTVRNENQYLFSFSIANIGNFGSLTKQTRLP